MPWICRVAERALKKAVMSLNKWIKSKEDFKAHVAISLLPDKLKSPLTTTNPTNASLVRSTS